MTVAPLCEGSETDIQYAIRSTYWDGLDLVAAAPFLFSAEFALPSRQMREKDIEFWNVLNAGLESVRFLAPVPPGAEIVIAWTPGDAGRIDFTGHAAGSLAFRGRARVRM